MNILLSVSGTKIAPVLDVARDFVLYSCQNARIIESSNLKLVAGFAMNLPHQIAETKTEMAQLQQGLTEKELVPWVTV